jgi:hypothetical protein
MEVTESGFVMILAAVNLAAGFGLSVPISRLLGEVTGRRDRFLRYCVVLVGIYFIECVAFAAGMATQIFSVGLAFVWGIVFGLWLRGCASPLKILRTSFCFALYTCLPTASFGILLLLGKLVGGSSVLSVEEAIGFGVPSFVPWPVCTILGFCMALVVGTIAFKTVITTGEISILIHLGQRSAVRDYQAGS